MVLDDIKIRLNHVLFVWKKQEKRNALLEISKEESINYEPKSSPLNIRMLVNYTIRNSIIEDLHTDKAFSKEFENIESNLIDEIKIKNITVDAIEYFKNEWPGKDLSNLVLENLHETHPITYNALLKLSKMTRGAASFNVISLNRSKEIEKKYDFFQSTVSTFTTTTLSGFSPLLDEQLSSIIFQIREEKGTLFIPFFKFLTRNNQKLYDIFELILSSGGSIVTLNYYISNGYVAKRDKFLKVAHTVDEVKKLLKNTNGLNKKHKLALQAIIKST